MYLSEVDDLLDQLTIVTGSSHPGVSGGHKAEGSMLTAAPYSRNAVFKNSISIDQELAKHLGHQTRFPSLTLNVTENNSPSYTENGSMIPAEDSPSKLNRKLFVADTLQANAQRIERLKQGQCVMNCPSGSHPVRADDHRRRDSLGQFQAVGSQNGWLESGALTRVHGMLENAQSHPQRHIC